MYRKLYNKLLAWKDSADRKPLILDGARQVGKTWLIEEEFGRKEFANIVKVDFRDRKNPVHRIFESGLSAIEIIENIAAYTSQSIVAGQTLLFFDEIQDSPLVIQSLKSFCEQTPEYHIVAAGSMLGIKIHSGEESDDTEEEFSIEEGNDRSFPVGKVNLMTLYPMDFVEFLRALGEEGLADKLQKGEPADVDIFHERYNNLLKFYFYVGGMPEVVKTFVVNRTNLEAVRSKQNEILGGYESDFAKYNTPASTIKLMRVWDNVPESMLKDDKKLVYGDIRKGARGRDYKDIIIRLTHIGLACRVKRCRMLQSPLKAYADDDSFKLYPLDCGLLAAMCAVSAMDIIGSESALTEFKGAFSETYALQQILASEYKGEVFYYQSDDSQKEIDFCLQMQDVLPIEIKSNKKVRSKSLDNYLKKEPGVIGWRVSMKHFGKVDNLVSIPLYMLGPYIDSKLREIKEQERKLVESLGL